MELLPNRPVFFRPLVEEKVKEQLEAAKPEPVIEEVVSTWAAPPACAASFSSCLFPTLLPSLPACVFLSLHSPWDWALTDELSPLSLGPGQPGTPET